MSSIPLHCACLAFGSDPLHINRVMGRFAPAEQIWVDDVVKSIAGDVYRTQLEPIILDEIEHRIVMRLRLGQRAIVDCENLDPRIRQNFIDRVASFGAPVYSLVCTSGENVAYPATELIDARANEPSLANQLPVEGALEYLSRRYDGITAVGDVHGMLGPLNEAIEWARDRKHYLVLAGDLLDYGPDTLAVADRVYDLVTAGEACLITGNHERKIMRWLDGYRVRLSEGNRVTTSALQGMGETARSRWIGRFRGLYQNSRLVQRIGNLTFAHAAVAPQYWERGRVSTYMENMAFFGEIDNEKSRPDRPVSSYGWTDAIPSGQIAVVGHNIRSRSHPIVTTNSNGGTALFLDTGSGKGGKLGSACFRFSDGDLKLRNFNIY